MWSNLFFWDAVREEAQPRAKTPKTKIKMKMKNRNREGRGRVNLHLLPSLDEPSALPFIYVTLPLFINFKKYIHIRTHHLRICEEFVDCSTLRSVLFVFIPAECLSVQNANLRSFSSFAIKSSHKTGSKNNHETQLGLNISAQRFVRKAQRELRRIQRSSEF